MRRPMPCMGPLGQVFLTSAYILTNRSNIIDAVGVNPASSKAGTAAALSESNCICHTYGYAY